MTDISQRIPINPLQAISLADKQPVQLQGAERERFEKEMKSVLEGAYTRPDGPTSHGDYAQVMVGGKVVATVENSGGAAMSNALGAQLGATLATDGEGPELAQRRAEQIAKAAGGTVVKASSAMSQSDWNNRPSLRTTVDFEAMKRDGLFEQWQRLGSGGTLSAQLLAQGQDG